MRNDRAPKQGAYRETRVHFVIGAAVIVGLGVIEAVQGEPPWAIGGALVPAVAAILFASKWVAEAPASVSRTWSVWMVRALTTSVLVIMVAWVVWPSHVIVAMLAVSVLLLAAVVVWRAWRLRKPAVAGGPE